MRGQPQPLSVQLGGGPVSQRSCDGVGQVRDVGEAAELRARALGLAHRRGDQRLDDQDRSRARPSSLPASEGVGHARGSRPRRRPWPRRRRRCPRWVPAPAALIRDERGRASLRWQQAVVEGQRGVLQRCGSAGRARSPSRRGGLGEGLAAAPAADQVDQAVDPADARACDRGGPVPGRPAGRAGRRPRRDGCRRRRAACRVHDRLAAARRRRRRRRRSRRRRPSRAHGRRRRRRDRSAPATTIDHRPAGRCRPLTGARSHSRGDPRGGGDHVGELLGAGPRRTC